VSSAIPRSCIGVVVLHRRCVRIGVVIAALLALVGCGKNNGHPPQQDSGAPTWAWMRAEWRASAAEDVGGADAGVEPALAPGKRGLDTCCKTLKSRGLGCVGPDGCRGQKDTEHYDRGQQTAQNGGVNLVVPARVAHEVLRIRTPGSGMSNPRATVPPPDCWRSDRESPGRQSMRQTTRVCGRFRGAAAHRTARRVGTGI
jgi:hypothetical protein